MRSNLLGVDIGGTKTAIIYGVKEDDKLSIQNKRVFKTTSCASTIESIFTILQCVINDYGLTPENTSSIGVSCGGPLDSLNGVVMSPPNLPGWDNIPITKMVTERFGIRSAIQNDANACALAEWKFGAGVGTRNMVFMTFGTGLGAGLILNGQLYAGTNDNAGELGHIRLSEFGPIGYGKAGSFEGFCSGGGIAQMAKMMVTERLQMGEKPALSPSYADLETLTAASVAEAAIAGDQLAIDIYRTSGKYLGRGLSIVIDMLNVEKIVIGGIFARSRQLLEPIATEIINSEALSHARGVCSIVPASLGENIGDYAALSVAANIEVAL